MGRQKTKTCNVCFKAMRSDHLKTHMKRHERGHEDNIVIKGLHDRIMENKVVTNGEQISCTSEKYIAFEKRMFVQIIEFDRKIEL